MFHNYENRLFYGRGGSNYTVYIYTVKDLDIHNSGFSTKVTCAYSTTGILVGINILKPWKIHYLPQYWSD